MMKVKFFIIVHGCFAKRHHATVPANPNMPVESKIIIIMLIKLKFEFCKNTAGIENMRKKQLALQCLKV